MSKIAIVDENIWEDAKRNLSKLGFLVITLPKFKKLPKGLQSHTDMLIATMGNEIISTCDVCESSPFVFEDLRTFLRGRKFSFTSDTLGDKYPDDCKLNVLQMGKFLFAKCDSVSNYLLESAKKQGLEIVKTKQGYPKCTTLAIDRKHAITADCGMAKALEEKGIEVLMIKSGSILLPPYEYGFIGGCAGVYKNTVYFTGNLTRHPSYSKIKAFLDSLSMNIVSLSSSELLDVGGILFLDNET